MQKQEKILTLFRNVLFILKSIKAHKKDYLVNLKKSKLYFLNKSFILKNFVVKKKFKINFTKKKSLRSYTNKFIRKKFKKEKIKKNFFKQIFLFNKILFKDIENYSLFFLNLKLNKYNVFFCIFKRKKFSRFFSNFYKKKSKKSISIFIKRNNYYYNVSLYFRKKLMFIKNSFLYKESKYKYSLIKKIMLLNLKINLCYFVKKFGFKKVVLNFFLKKKRRLKKKGLKKYTINFIDDVFFTNAINLYKFFKKINIEFVLNLHYIKSHSVRTEKLKKKRRK